MQNDKNLNNVPQQELSDEKIKGRCKYAFGAGVTGIVLILPNLLISSAFLFASTVGYVDNYLKRVIGIIVCLVVISVIYLPYILALVFAVKGSDECLRRNLAKERSTFNTAIILNIIALVPIVFVIIENLVGILYLMG